MPHSLKFGLIGAARIARKAHIPGFLNANQAVLHGITSRDLEKSRSWAQECSIPKVYPTYDEMLADPEIEAVLICLVHTHHAEWVIKALAAGKHVLCEKPMAPHQAEVEAMCRAAQSHNRLLMEAFHHRLSPQFDFVDDLLERGEIGEIKIIRSELTYPIDQWDGDTRTDPSLDASVLLEAGCYCVNTIRHFMGSEPIEMKACAGFHQPGHFDSTLSAVMKFSRERTALMHTSMEAPFRATCEIIGTQGRIEMPELFTGSKILITRGTQSKVKSFPVIDRFAAQLDHFIDCVRGNATPRVSLTDSLGNIAVIEQLLQSAGVRSA